MLISATAWGAVPAGAKKLLPVLHEVFAAYWPEAPYKPVVAGQVEQESGWKERAHLHTSREDGYGLVQMTVTRSFNIFDDAVRMKPLKGWNWKADPYNPRNQLTFLVIQDRGNFAEVSGLHFKDGVEATKAMLVSYNAGLGRVLKRRQYAIARGIPHDRWTGGLDRAHGAAESSLLYGRSLWKAVNEYPVVIFQRAAKYEGAL